MTSNLTTPLLEDTSGTYRIAIIGAGWTGLQVTQALKERGISAEMFDFHGSVGGTWTPEMSYQSLFLHSPRWLNQLLSNGKKFPWKQADAEFLDAKAAAEEVHDYLDDFARTNDLMRHINFKTRVMNVHHDSKSGTAHLTVLTDASVEVRKGPYDFVVYASMSSKPKVPDIPNDGFLGKMLHSHQLKQDLMTEIISKHSKVLVLGGSKSACDMICAFQMQSYDQVTWLFRKPYFFWKYEKLFHRLSIVGVLRGFLACTSLLLFLLFPNVGLFALWAIGLLVQPASSGFPAHFNAKYFHFGTLDINQVAFIKKIRPIVGEPQKLCKDGVMLKNGDILACDVIICATGYETGFSEIELLKDGKSVSIKDVPLFEHAIVPTFPSLISANTAFYHFGPLRGVTLAQYIDYRLQSELPSEEHMVKCAASNFCTQQINQFMAYSSNQSFTQQWLYIYVDLMRAGLLSFHRFVRLALELFVCNSYQPLKLRVGSCVRG